MNAREKVLFICILFVTSLRADERPLSFHGFVDGYYAWNTNEPRSHENFINGTGTTAKRANEMNLNLAALDIAAEPKPVGFHLSLVAGSGTDVVHAGEPQGTAVGRDVYRWLYQASILYKPSDRLTLEGGIFPSHIGFESFYSKDNWNYTRGWLGEFSPYYQAGVHAGYRFSNRWSGEIHILNGWQIIGENNDAKAIDGKIAYATKRLTASLNTFDGPELPNDNRHWRHFGNLIALYTPVPALSLGASIDRGHQLLPRGRTANWLGLAGYARRSFGHGRHALAVRVERFRDPDNGISGVSQTLTEGTITYEVRPADGLVVKIEGRRDHSTAAVFRRQSDDVARNQTLVVIGAVATF